MAAPGLRTMLAAGRRDVSRYTGTVLTVFIVQTLIAAICMLGVAFVLAQTFSRLPMFDDAVDGDLVALIWCVRYARPSLLAVGGLVFGTVVLWQLVAWFLAGGLYGVLAQQPDGREATARCFGASGASTYLGYARLAICALPGWALVVTVFSVCTGIVSTRYEHALSVSDLVLPLTCSLVPALLVLHLCWTVTDYARVQLTLRHDSHRPSAVITYLKSFGYVLRNPRTLVHAGLGWLTFVIITVAYAFLAQGHPMYGVGGALALFVARQGVALVRIAIRIAVMAGQIELGRDRPLPTRRAKPDPDVT